MPRPAPLSSIRTAVVPAEAVVSGHFRVEALDIRGRVVGVVECGFGPLVIYETGCLEGCAVAKGDVVVAGTVLAADGREPISTPGRLVLLAGARVLGDVRCGAIEIREGATLEGAARGHPGATQWPCRKPGSAGEKG